MIAEVSWGDVYMAFYPTMLMACFLAMGWAGQIRFPKETKK